MFVTIISVSDVTVWMGNDAMWNDICVSWHSAVRPQPTPDTENLWTCDWQWAMSLVTGPVLSGTPPQEDISCPSEQRRDPWAGSNAVLPRCQTPSRGRDPVSFPETSQSLSSPPAIKTEYFDTWQTYTGVLCYSHRIYSYIQCINQQLHSVKYNKIRIIKYNSWQVSHSYVFRPEDVTPVPKHVGVWYLSWTVFYDFCFIVFYRVHRFVGALNVQVYHTALRLPVQFVMTHGFHPDNVAELSIYLYRKHISIPLQRPVC